MKEAKLRDDYALGSVIAFGGHEYVKDSWRPVPEGQEISSESHPFLELRDVSDEQKTIRPSIEPATTPPAEEEEADSKKKK